VLELGAGAKTQAQELNMKNKLLILGLAVSTLGLISLRADDTQATYDKQCAKCHGPDGKGDTKMGKKLGCKDYTDAKVQAEMKDEEAAKAIKEGLKDKDGKTLMKPAEGITDEQVKALVGKMRSFKK
jgi:mono/diheme cytochrome c family protein